MELSFLAVAFACGFLVLQCKLPPLIGFLIAGFILNFIGYTSTPLLENLANLGVTLLLFSIGLKLKIKSLCQKQVWGPASLHIVLNSLLFSVFLWSLSFTNLPLLGQLNYETALLLAFALSFSSTVFAVKVLEERGEMAAIHGKLAIGILVMQDIFAVLFLAVSKGAAPNMWLIAVIIAMPLVRIGLFWILERSKHGEVLPLFGFFCALIAGYYAFEFAGVKGDLGALIVGMMLASHKKASELSKSLLNFKDLLLIGFFLTIGLNAHVTINAVLIALFLVLLLPIKLFLYYFFFNRAHLRARTSVLSTFTLANYSEFGLIVCALATSLGWLNGEWLAVIAISVSITFVLATWLNNHANETYVRHENYLAKFESPFRLAEEKPVELNQAKILVFGMGRVGTGAYETISDNHPGQVAGVDIKPDCIRKHKEKGRFAILADATDPDFWRRINHSEVEMIMLTMPKHSQNLLALEELRLAGFKGQVTAIAYYPDQQKELERLGVTATYNFYLEAGAGFAEHVKDKVFG